MALRLTTYIRQSREELRKVSWPARQRTIKSTVVVIGFSLAVALFLGAIDYVLNLGLRAFIER